MSIKLHTYMNTTILSSVIKISIMHVFFSYLILFHYLTYVLN